MCLQVSGTALPLYIFLILEQQRNQEVLVYSLRTELAGLRQGSYVTYLKTVPSLAQRRSRGPEQSFHGCHKTQSGHPHSLVSHTVLSASDYSSFMNIYVLIYMYSECIYMCIYIFKEQVHCKKLELNLLCQYDILLAEDILFMDISYGCYGNKAAASGPFCGAA